MSAIQSSVGLITGIPIQDTVDQLIAIASRPRDQLLVRNQGVQAEQAAVDTLSSLVLSLQFSTNQLNNSSTFTSRTVNSSSNAVSATVANGATPPVGSYQFTPLKSASSHQFVSQNFSDLTDAIGSGSLTFGFGGQVDQSVALADFNSGAGVAAGEVEITDASGDSAVVDLRAAQTVEDVLLAINSTTGIRVTAATRGDAIVLTDDSGGNGSLSVEDIGLGTTASDLGLADGNFSGGELTGLDRYTLHSGTRLDALNDGAGVRISDDLTDVDDLTFSLRDGTTTFGVDLSGSTTLGDVVDAINNDSDNTSLLTAAISGDGRGITITDNTGSTAANLVIGNGVIGNAAEDLGIVADAASDSVTGSRLVSGLRDTLVGQLNGGSGFTLGQIAITDRAGNPTATVDLQGLDTLEAIIDRINSDASSTNVRARVNDSRSGIVLEDTIGGSGSLVVANNDATNSATLLGLEVSDTVNSVDSGSLNRQTVSEATLLSDFNGGSGVSLGDIRITDSSGASYAIDLNSAGSEAQTIGDVIDAVNSATGNTTVVASINATGDGILLTDNAAGQGTLTVAEVGSGTTAADLNLLGASTSTGSPQTIDGSTSYTVDLTDLEQTAESISLSSLNGGAGVDLGLFNVTASNGSNFVVDLGEAGSEAFTVGDVINLINTAASDRGINVVAAVNSAGTGIEITDNTVGVGELTIEDLGGSGSAAADLNLIRTAADSESNIIDGAGLFTAADGEQGALETLVDRINGLGAGVTASIVSDLSGFRLAITADEPGAANALVIDGGSTSFGFQETSRPADAVALFGNSAFGGGFTVTSTSNEFNSVIDGVNLTVNEVSGTSATIEVLSDDSPLISSVQSFVDAYNSIRSNLDSVTDFNEETLTTGILFGRNEALRVDADLARIVSGSFLTGVTYGSLESVGVSLNDDGTLSLDTSQLSDAYADDPTGVENLFSDSTNGVVAQITAVTESLATNESSLLSSRSEALQRTIDSNNDRVASFDEQLTRERDRLLLEFFRLEETIALLQSNLTSIESIQGFASLTSSNNSN